MHKFGHLAHGRVPVPVRCADVLSGPAANWRVAIVVFERVNQRVRQARGSGLRDQAVFPIPKKPGI